MLSNSENSSGHISVSTQKYGSDGASLNGFNKDLSNNSNAELIVIELNENTYVQLDSNNSLSSVPKANLNDTDLKNNLDKSTITTNSPFNASKESEYTALTSTTSESKIKLGESFSWGGYFQAIGVLFLLLGIFCVILWIMRKYGKFSFLPNSSELPKNAIRLEAQLPLGPRKSLSVVRYLDKRLLLGVTDQQITLLSESKVNSDTDDTDDTEFKEFILAEQKQNEGK